MSVTYVSPTLRRLVYERARGCCEYCLISEIIGFERHQIDHIIAEKHGGDTHKDNLALSCRLCNTFKGSDIASVDDETGQIVPLFNPRSDDWNEHFKIEFGSFVGLTPNARATIQLLRLNSLTRIEERLS
jgi:5-methylcytosine-specific restriction endonuclease McrA